ncbi:MAG: rod shape-determining protein MreD [Lachnospiraceae bacterium]|nr:rod shape-determining protein MreD [Lachnospiraceae bacterium]
MIRVVISRTVQILTAALLFLLQITWFKGLEIASVSPNLLIIFIASIGVLRGSREGMIIGFISGLFVDIYFAELIGFYALIYMFIGYIIGLFKRIFFAEDIKLPLILIMLGNALFNVAVYVFKFMLKGDLSFPYYVMNLILPEVMYTFIVALFLLPIILKVNNLLEEYEKKGASKFG